jgi:NADH-quinone oxidoreductase subunit N
MAPMIPFDNSQVIQGLASVAPEAILVCTSIVVLMVDLFLQDDQKGALCWLSLAGVLAAIGAVAAIGPGKIVGFSGMVTSDAFGMFFSYVVLAACALVLLMASGWAERSGAQKGEFYSLILMSVSGMLLMVKGTDLITVFLGLETLSIPIYVLVGFNRSRMTSIEGALKYFLLGAFGAAFMLYGMALVYAATGTTKISVLTYMVAGGAMGSNLLFVGGIGLLLVGFAFKVSLAPFHMWTPDAYEGAPTLITAFMSAAVKAAAFAALIRVATLLFPGLAGAAAPILWLLAVMTMTVGNFTALVQNNVKRILAYSSIAHAGYILVGMVSGDELGRQASLFYLLVYAFMNIGAFGVLMLVAQKEDDGYELDNLRGIGFKYPVLGALMTLFLVSLAGVPPTGGFIGKFYLFSSAVKGGYIWLAILGVLNSAASIYYYLRIVVYMYFIPAEKEVVTPHPQTMLYAVALCACAIVVLVLGLVPGAVLDAALESARSLLL